MDPYVVVEYRSKQKKTRVIRGGGKTPVWKETLEFAVQNRASDSIRFRCMDEDLFSDDIIGEATVQIQYLLKEEGFRLWIPVYYKEKKAGEIQLEARW